MNKMIYFHFDVRLSYEVGEQYVISSKTNFSTKGLTGLEVIDIHLQISWLMYLYVFVKFI